MRTGLCLKAVAVFLIGDSANKVYEIPSNGKMRTAFQREAL